MLETANNLAAWAQQIQRAVNGRAVHTIEEIEEIREKLDRLKNTISQLEGLLRIPAVMEVPPGYSYVAPVTATRKGTIDCSSETCPIKRECANHVSAGDYRMEDGTTPALVRYQEFAYYCGHTAMPDSHGYISENGQTRDYWNF